MANKVTIDDLNSSLLDTINNLKQGNATAEDVERAKAIADLGKVMVEGYKVKAQVLRIVADEYPDSAREMLRSSGIQDVNALPAAR